MVTLLSLYALVRYKLEKAFVIGFKVQKQLCFQKLIIATKIVLELVLFEFVGKKSWLLCRKQHNSISKLTQ